MKPLIVECSKCQSANTSDDPEGSRRRPISDAERERLLLMSDDPRIWRRWA